ncbi:probable Delta(3,5)-Delta(2,4)-dienoyl-CoA isomerase, mitochondrial precursor [Rhynchosporium agropyri]|uniref:Probable Delta(3,5)-Delta(2,4)-dienoyl-CoA isomerase, mitochondrial n=1 Tax=Rhynchosporium agropyri TaxID=914238 RepID=A0A1E1KX53_9HELO|nr:probable Delta(3,5)-Delta(2,4)-dienoyl-CoA isomerase, mitochondrial precursor [Rhynchosporium agropyri]
MASPNPSYEYFLVTTPIPNVAHVLINRPQKMNSFHEAMWLELKIVFDTLSISQDVRAIVFSGAGDRAFTTGLDVQAASQEGVLKQQEGAADVARVAVGIKRFVQEFQDCVSSIEKCEKPVICVLHGYSFGLAIDLSTCADIRICTSDVKLAVKEVDIGLAADIGTLTRLPKIVGNFSWVKDVSLTARLFGAEEAYRVGFVSQVLENKDKAIEAALKMGELLASKSPVAVQSTKELLNHARDQTVASSLRYTGVWNSAAIQTEDVQKAMLSGIKKTKPTYSKL